MRFRKVFALLLSAALIFCLAACGSAPQPETSGTTVTDMIGRQVEIQPGSYSRAVCIGAGALRLYSYVADPAKLAGVEDIDNLSLAERPKMFDSVARPYVLAYSDAFASLPSCGVGGPTAQTAEAEKILSCDPDIVISAYEDVQKADALQEQLGVPVIVVSTGAKGVFDPAFAGSLRLLGQVFGTQEKAEALVSFVEAETAAIEERVADIPDGEKPLVYVCGLGNWGTTNHLMTAENFVSFQIAGVKNVVSGLGLEGIGPIEAEKFVELGTQMDLIIMDAAAIKNIQPLYQEDPTLFDTNKAWQEGQVYLEMAYNAYYTNFEIALINTWFIAKTVYPEAFADIDLTAKTNEVTERFLGKPLAEAIFACPSSFGGYGKVDISAIFG